ncbi:MAG: NUDIX hydrolase [Rikenellaceae bacterium]|jgi:8-oxo-dGTP diphosphatase|nr:NUDIX hydrolase [Rikenellaceae bacterium]
MTPATYSPISVDCVVFGFDGNLLKVLLVPRRFKEAGSDGRLVERQDCKLPGSLIFDDEDLTQSAYRILGEIIDTNNIYLKQLHVFSNPDRIDSRSMEWLNETYRVEARRIVTVAYYSLVKLTPKMAALCEANHGEWHDVQSIRKLALDHKSILMRALETLNKQLVNEPIAFELLPRRFTIRQLQMLYEAILGVEVDNRNFRKKLLSSGYLEALDEKEHGVAHKPARFYQFNKSRFEREARRKTKLNFINWQG